MRTFYVNAAGHEEQLVVRVERYRDNERIALAIDSLDGDVFCIATCNVPEAEVGPREVILKNWSENEGIEYSLIEAVVIEPYPVKFVSTDFVQAPVYKLTAAFCRENNL